eukprot:s2277_g1.t1
MHLECLAQYRAQAHGPPDLLCPLCRHGRCPECVQGGWSGLHDDLPRDAVGARAYPTRHWHSRVAPWLALLAAVAGAAHLLRSLRRRPPPAERGPPAEAERPRPRPIWSAAAPTRGPAEVAVKEEANSTAPTRARRGRRHHRSDDDLQALLARAILRRG